MILDDPTFAFRYFRESYVHHGARQVVGTNYLVREQQSKCRVDRAQQAVAEVRFLPRFHGVDVGGSKDLYPREPCTEQRLFRLALTARERHPTSAGRVRALAT